MSSGSGRIEVLQNSHSRLTTEGEYCYYNAQSRNKKPPACYKINSIGFWLMSRFMRTVWGEIFIKVFPVNWLQTPWYNSLNYTINKTRLISCIHEVLRT